jgi:hypothetical protein
MNMKHKGMRYLYSGLTVLFGAGATLGGSYLFSRLREKQDVETRMDRLEQMLEGLAGPKGEPKAPRQKKR